MFRFLIVLLGFIFALEAPAAAYAQSTAQRGVLGYNTTSGCPGGAPSCWVPYDSTGAGIPISATSATGVAPIVGGSAASSQVLKSTPGNLYSAYATCTAACWLMVFNATAAPSNGATTAGTGSGNLQDCIPIASGGLGTLNYAPGPPEAFSVGITATISSTACATLTLSTVGFIHGVVQ